MLKDKKGFKEALLKKREFVYTLELVPGRGSRGKTQDDLLKMVEKVEAANLVHAVSITDNPGGHPALSPNVIGLEVSRLGIDPIVHFTCKDKNRNQIESTLYSLDRIGISNLLLMTGDFPLYGFEGKAKPVFDLDSIQLLHLINQLNLGIKIDGKAPGGGVRLPPTHFLKGCTVSPFKKLESEVMAQYFKLFRKVKAGADFVITQVGFDARKFDELLRWMRQNGFQIPILGNVYILNQPVAKVMNQKRVPGCVVTDDLFKIIEKEAMGSDGGRKARLNRAAKMVAILKGLGYDGVHLGGPHLTFEDIQWVIGTSKEFFSKWEEDVREFSFPQPGGFYLFEKDPTTGLNMEVRTSLKSHLPKALGYSLMRLFHHLAFTPEAPLYKPARWFYQKKDVPAFISVGEFGRNSRFRIMW